MDKILVLGSSNMDLILRIPRFHGPGETILSEDLITAFGGKGANQAMAAKRLGGQVNFVTKLGRDPYGKSYRKYLTENGFPRNFLLTDETLPTGVALIELIPRGENRIAVSPGANHSLEPLDLKKIRQAWKKVSVFVTQLEIPLATVKAALHTAKRSGILTLLNPSPPVDLDKDLLSGVDFLVPNEGESQLLSGRKIKGRSDIPGVARRLLDRGVRNVIITLGSRGLFFANRREEMYVPAFPVKAVDTTAAGDALMGALACALAEGKPVREVLRFASAAGALAATRLGAQPSLPGRTEVERFLRKRL